MGMIVTDAGMLEEPIISYKGDGWSGDGSYMHEDACGTVCYTNAEGQLHRENGPAVIWADKTMDVEFWIDGQELTVEQFDAWYCARNKHDTRNDTCEILMEF